MKSLFTAHPASVGETYGEHMAFAAGFGWRMTLGGLACLVHAVLPFLFATTASRTVGELQRRMAGGGRTAPAPGPDAAGEPGRAETARAG